jgi:hypothetical protein
MSRDNPSRQECVLRALTATEIAETCHEPRLRASFFELAESWLDRAEHLDDAWAPEASVH